MDVSGDISLSAAQRAALLKVLPDTGDSVELKDVGIDDDGVIRAGVKFTCMSDHPCTVTVSNSAGTIVAMYASQVLGDGTVSAMATGLAADVVDTFARLNAGNTGRIRFALNPDNPAGSGADTMPSWTPTELIGMGIGGPGVLNADMAGLRSDFQANGADTASTAAAPGVTPGLTMGTTITGADDAIDPSDDMAPAPAGWNMKTLFRDWGDTEEDSSDGGFETGAIVVKNLGEGTAYPFDRKLSRKYVNPAAQAMFALAIRADGKAPGVTTLGTSVYIGADPYTPENSSITALPAATSTQWENVLFHPESLVAAQNQDLHIDKGETFFGWYFDAPGQFQCIVNPCSLMKMEIGDDKFVIVVNDRNPSMTEVETTGGWSFTPLDDAMIMVPDQDWMAYGAWLTTPDDAAGNHRLGVFFNGMDPYNPAQNALTASDKAGLRGSATYSGGATGVYVDRTMNADGRTYTENSGLFTADATLTAHFDSTSNGTDDAADTDDTNDYSISGRIDNFRGTDGVFLGDDTQASPNDRTAGENDWVVLLGRSHIGDNADDNDAVTGNPALAIPDTATSGSADGVSWSGMWNGMFFGPNADADGDPIKPSGVAGRFWANTGDPDGAGQVTLTANHAVTSVAGSFGATKDADD